MGLIWHSEWRAIFRRVGKIAKSDCQLRHICPSVRPFLHVEELGSHRTDSYEIWYLRVFRKFRRENSSFIKIKQEYCVLYMRTNTHFWSYLAQFFLEREMFQIKVVEKIKTHVLCSVTFFKKSCLLWDNMEICCTAGQVTDDSMAHAHCMLDN